MSTEVPLPEDARPYPGAAITVTFEAARCVHAAACVRGLPEVFDTASRPWIQPDAAPAERIAQVVRRCPSGALQYRLAAGPPEQPTHPTEIARSLAGPITIRGDLLIHTASGPRHETRAILCGCGASHNQPFCDRKGDCENSSPAGT